MKKILSTLAIIILIVLCLFAFTSFGESPAGSPEPEGKIEEELKILMDSVIAESHVPGLVAGIWAPDKGVSFIYTAGVSDLETNAPMDEDMVFRIGSNTKTFTNTVLLQLVDEGLINLNDTLSKYLPDYPRSDEVSIDFNASGRRTHELITGTGLEKALGGNLLFKGLDAHVRRGTRLGIAGNNASGKTTLLKVLGDLLKQDAGSVKHATDLRVSLFDQQREQLDLTVTLRRALAPQGDNVSFLGRSTHVAAWAKQFGFRVDQLTMPVGELSGGEKARVLMAMMMREPADVLMLDEPTNDLDIRSIEVLEQGLIDFPGAVILITHDRHMLDRVCTDLIGLHGEGRWGNYASVAQWLEADQSKNDEDAKPSARSAKAAAVQDPPKAKLAKLTYHEKKELADMEEAILAAENALEVLQTALDEANVASDHMKLVELHAEQQEAQDRVDTLYARWEELEGKAG